jgi:hypothetical protein
MMMQRPAPSAPQRFTVPTLVHVGNGESVQVELMTPRMGTKAKSVVLFEAVQDLSPTFQQYPGSDCSTLSQSAGTARAEVAVEIEVPAVKQLPDGRVRVFRRAAKTPDRLEVLSEDQLRTSAGSARVRLAAHTEVTGERKQIAGTCKLDERARTITEQIEVKVENKAKQAAEVVVREFMFRAPVWRIDPADETVKGTRAASQTQEYRLSIPAGGKKAVTYTVVYSY